MKTAYRLALVGWMISWLVVTPWKLRLHPFLILEHPLESDFFPRLLADPYLFAALWLAPAATGIAAMILCRRTVCTVHAAVLVASSLVLMDHQLVFWAQAFVASFWAGLWMLWAGRNLDGGARERSKGAFLALAVISVVYLGAAIGKWTDGYWSGEVLGHLGSSSLSGKWATRLLGYRLYSRIIVVTETALGLSWLAPPRLALPFCVLVFVAQWLSTFNHVLDALGPVLGIGLAGLWLTLRPGDASRAEA